MTVGSQGERSTPLTGVVVGAGDRGYDAYARLFLDEASAGRIVAVAEPDPDRRERFAARYGLTASACHSGWEDLFDRERLADFALVTTGDAHHVAPTLAALRRGYDVLLEKPMALDEGECLSLVEAAEASGRILAVCHVYRYSHLFAGLLEVIASGELGDVVSIQLSENVAYWHYAHSYVRGHTRRATVPWLLQKSCHDLDLIAAMADAPAAEVASFARQTELTEANAPPGAPGHCIEGCPHASSCPYDAVAIYRDLEPLIGALAQEERPLGLSTLAATTRAVRPTLMRVPLPALRRRLQWWRWPVSAVTDDHTPAGLDRALRTTRWGRCAYKVGDNDQPSAQVVSIRFANGVVGSFTLQSVSQRSMRQVRVDGTRGSASGRLFALGGTLEVADHKSGRIRRVRVPAAFDGHGGGERPLFADFLDAVRTRHEPRVSARASLESHRIAFAALRSAATGEVVRLDAPD